VYEQLALLREPFPPEQIGKLPKGGVTLDFVGHAHLTGRLLDVDPLWSWEPFALDQNGLPKFDENGGLWIWLTVCGVRRIGYGDSGGKQGPNGVKEAIGDALRNAGMRFGAALDLWAKDNTHSYDDRRQQTRKKVEKPVRAANQDALDSLQSVCQKYGIKPAEAAGMYASDNDGADIRTASADSITDFTQQLIIDSAAAADPLGESVSAPASEDDLF
jgi:hypothetical protein